MASQICWVVTILTVISMICVYSPYLIPATSYIISHSSRKIIQPELKLQQSLEQLIQSPVIGPLFYQQLISTLANNQQWQKVLVHANQAVKGEINTNKFIIWYYKALAQCINGQKQLCERSVRIASGLTKGSSEYSLKQIFSLIKLLEENKDLKFQWTKGQNGATLIMHKGKQDNSLESQKSQKSDFIEKQQQATGGNRKAVISEL